MGAITTIPTGASPVERILTRFDRVQLEGFIAVAIDLLDIADGDPDVEPNGDELDGSTGEDDFHYQCANWLAQPACPLSDPGGEHDGSEPDHLNVRYESDDPFDRDHRYAGADSYSAIPILPRWRRRR